MSYVVDTNIFNWLLDGRIEPGDLPRDGEYVATHVQIDELNRTADAERRGSLFLKFAEMRPRVVPTESGVWGASRWGQAKWSDGKLFGDLKGRLDARNCSRRNNSEDALIAEVAIANGFTLLTADSDLAAVVSEFGGEVRLYET